MGNSEIQAYFKGLQRVLIERLTFLDPDASQTEDAWQRAEGGGGVTHVFTNGSLIEKGGVNFSHVTGASLPPSATRTRPQLADRPFEAMGVSVVLHPENPHVPTTHLNVRFFSTREDAGRPPVWWFGGGFDLTPAYGYSEDAVAWHTAARQACVPFGADLYPRFKAACDAYFFLPHRNEARGIGGVFFDDFDELGFDRSFALTRSIGDAFLPAWESIALARSRTRYSQQEKTFQQYRRGRYVEFNLLYDRGTLFGLQSGGRTESILMSLPPHVQWIYDYTPAPNSPEASLVRDFLKPCDWITHQQ